MVNNLAGAIARRPIRVPEITAYFWILKGLSTALGESASDYLVRVLTPVPAVVLDCLAFVIALAVQFTRRRYVTWTYWFAVVMVGVFGTIAADVLHVGLGVPYLVSTVLCGALLAAVYLLWWRREGTLSIHAVDSARREAFYWAAVVATFALGTSAGDLAATTFGLGYFGSIVVFAIVILIPAMGYRWLRWNGVFSFWFAYVVTRPLGASIADWLGKPVAEGGAGVGVELVSLVLAVAIVALVGVVSVRGRRRESASADLSGH
ncbi:COG4705 family protein [Amycolatopsis pithecellobii]|uniref:Membrane-anchored protein n=1 Tax=Amycolatopsis pithecellobii TaxID=664692 RepID=A0A6N7Z0W8_9PSEU|nr:hypothetical protein [Amycolatopsis pithecellobii]MTD53134.1 hypothetical protein [Amycolatopsis pithecellobii]